MSARAIAPVVGIVAAAVGLGIVASVLASEAEARFTVASGVRYWALGQAPAIRKALAAAHLEPLGTERTWLVVPGLKPGHPSALDEVRAMQMRGSAVTSTTNLLDAGARRGVAEVLAAELEHTHTGDEREGTAILPIGV